MDRDRILLTPGPLTTTLRTKLAMLRDWGSWDADFNAITARLRGRLLDIVDGQDTHVVVPLQGSGTFSVEAAVATLVPRDGHVLVPDNGAYCKRAARLTHMMGRRCTVLPFAEDQPVSAAAVDERLKADASITHVVLIHCETGTGVENPLASVAAVCRRTCAPLTGVTMPARFMTRFTTDEMPSPFRNGRQGAIVLRNTRSLRLADGRHSR